MSPLYCFIALLDVLRSVGYIACMDRKIEKKVHVVWGDIGLMCQSKAERRCESEWKKGERSKEPGPKEIKKGDSIKKLVTENGKWPSGLHWTSSHTDALNLSIIHDVVQDLDCDLTKNISM